MARSDNLHKSVEYGPTCTHVTWCIHRAVVQFGQDIRSRQNTNGLTIEATLHHHG